MKKSLNSDLKMLVALVIMAAFTLLFSFPKMVLAEANNIFVEDYAEILSNQDKAYIKDINEEDFIKLPGKPQYVVVTLNDLDGYDSIEDYAEKKFQKLGIGDKDLDNGFLFVISVGDRKYRLETGYGVEDVITDSMKEQVVTDQAQNLLEDGQYGNAVMVISKNIQSLVNQKYGDIDAAKEVIQKEKEREAKIVKMIFLAILGVILLIVAIILYYLLSIKKLQNQLDKKYLNKNLNGFIYVNKVNQLTGASKGIKQVNLSHYLAKTLNKRIEKQKLLSDDASMKEWIAQYLLIDSIITYWRESKSVQVYDVSVYIESKYLDRYKQEQIPKSSYFSYPLASNPFLSTELSSELSNYVNGTLAKHKEALRISKENKKYIERVSELFLEQNKIRLRKVDHQLEVALMVYYFLQEKDLSDPNLLKKIQIDDNTLTKALRFAEKRRKQIASDQKRQALDDLTNMTLGSYYMQAMIWSSYRSSSSSSSFGGGGGSSFGGGSSGGGGFSGGW